jgi:hypothetical protein
MDIDHRPSVAPKPLARSLAAVSKRINGRHLPTRFLSRSIARVFGTASLHNPFPSPLPSLLRPTRAKTPTAPPRPPSDMAAAAAAGSSAASLAAPIPHGDKVGALPPSPQPAPPIQSNSVSSSCARRRPRAAAKGRRTAGSARSASTRSPSRTRRSSRAATTPTGSYPLRFLIPFPHHPSKPAPFSRPITASFARLFCPTLARQQIL